MINLLGKVPVYKLDCFFSRQLGCSDHFFVVFFHHDPVAYFHLGWHMSILCFCRVYYCLFSCFLFIFVSFLPFLLSFSASFIFSYSRSKTACASLTNCVIDLPVWEFQKKKKVFPWQQKINVLTFILLRQLRTWFYFDIVQRMCTRIVFKKPLQCSMSIFWHPTLSSLIKCITNM